MSLKDEFLKNSNISLLWTILSDSAMMISSILISSFLKDQSVNIKIIIMIVLVYLVPYLIYTV